MTPGKLNLTIYKGSTFGKSLRWESGTLKYAPITGVTKSAPVVITSTAHGIPNGWRAAITGVKGMTQLNAKGAPPKESDYKQLSVESVNTLSINSVNSVDYTDYTSGGMLQYYEPNDLTGFTARMSIKDKVGGTELFSLTTENSRIEIFDTDYYIALNITAADTAAMTFSKGVYDLELVNTGSGAVYRLIQGTITVKDEVTT